MTFGGFSPMPVRLGGSAEEGWTAAQFLRTAADVAAVARTAPFAVVRVTRSADETTAIIDAHTGRYPSGYEPVGDAHPSGWVSVEFPVTIPDQDGVERPVVITHARATAHNIDGSAISTAVRLGLTTAGAGDFTNRNAVSAIPSVGGEVTITFVIHAIWDEPARYENYGGAPDKRDCQTETVPYAFHWYQELGASLGTAYGQQTTGIVHARKLALARQLAAVYRSDERARCNTVPGTADALLDRWAASLLVPIGQNDPNWLVRQRCAAKFAAVAGSSLTRLESALQELLGARFVSISTNFGSALSDPPESEPPGTSWGPTFDLGNGTWASQRAHVQVLIDRPQDPKDPEFLDLMNVQFPRLMEDLVPAWATYDWSDVDADGFTLDVDLLDFDGL